MAHFEKIYCEHNKDLTDDTNYNKFTSDMTIKEIKN